MCQCAACSGQNNVREYEYKECRFQETLCHLGFGKVNDLRILLKDNTWKYCFMKNGHGKFSKKHLDIAIDNLPLYENRK